MQRWPVVWGSGEVTLDGDQLTARGVTIDLSGAQLSLARWSYGGANTIGACLLARSGDTILTIASAITPRGKRYDGSVTKPAAIIGTESFGELYEAVRERLPDPDPGDDKRFELAPRTSRSTAGLFAALPIMVALVLLIQATDDIARYPYLVPIFAVVLAGTIAFAWWAIRRAAPLTLHVEDNQLRLTGGPGGEQQVERKNLIAAVGHVAVVGRGVSVKSPALELTIGKRPIVVQSTESSQSAKGIALGRFRQIFLLPPDRFERMSSVLRLK